MSARTWRVSRGALAMTAALVIGLTGCAASTTGVSDGADSGAPPAAAPTVVSHIHGVDVDDARNVVTIATHEGLVTIDMSADASPTAAASVLGDYRGDVMAFVRAGERLLLSGHPAYGSSEAPNVGVLDADLDARQWAPLALSGEADFHAMSRASSASSGSAGSSPLIAGLDSVSGAVLSSDDDGVTWQQGTSIAARDIAIDVDGMSLIVTTELGPQRSVDRGMTWSLIDGAPLLVLVQSGVDLAGSPALVGVDLDGVLHVSGDGSEWQSQGALPFVPEGVGVGEGGTIVIVSTQVAMRSSDGGATWTQIANMALPLEPPQ